MNIFQIVKRYDPKATDYTYVIQTKDPADPDWQDAIYYSQDYNAEMPCIFDFQAEAEAFIPYLTGVTAIDEVVWSQP